MRERRWASNRCRFSTAATRPRPVRFISPSGWRRALPEAHVELKHGAEGTRSLRSIVLSGDSEVTITRPDKATLEVHAGGRIRRSTTRVVIGGDTDERRTIDPRPRSGFRQGAGMSDLRVFQDAHAAAGHCAAQILQYLRDSEQSTLAISGGSSPKPMFEIFAAVPFDWNRVQLFWVDERCVPLTDSQEQFQTGERCLARAREISGGEYSSRADRARSRGCRRNLCRRIAARIRRRHSASST